MIFTYPTIVMNVHQFDFFVKQVLGLSPDCRIELSEEDKHALFPQVLRFIKAKAKDFHNQTHIIFVFKTNADEAEFRLKFSPFQETKL